MGSKDCVFPTGKRFPLVPSVEASGVDLWNKAITGEEVSPGPFAERFVGRVSFRLTALSSKEG